MAINEKNGKHAVTHYRVLERFANHTYIECQLETGRTHQIRVHMASLHHPLLGDTVYGSQKNPYHLEVTAPLPEYFQKLLKRFSAGQE